MKRELRGSMSADWALDKAIEMALVAEFQAGNEKQRNVLPFLDKSVRETIVGPKPKPARKEVKRARRVIDIFEVNSRPPRR